MEPANKIAVGDWVLHNGQAAMVIIVNGQTADLYTPINPPELLNGTLTYGIVSTEPISKLIRSTQQESSVRPPPNSEPMTRTPLIHEKLGPCDLVRVEGTDWIIRVHSSGREYRFPSETRSQFQKPEPPPTPVATTSTSRIDPQVAAARKARRTIESLRIGLPALDETTRQLAVGFHHVEKHIRNLLDAVDQDGGRAMVIKGSYGQGKTFALAILEEMALESGFLTVRTEIDASENRLNKPHRIYQDLMRNLRMPGAIERGVRPLALAVDDLLKRSVVQNSAPKRRGWLFKNLGCEPLNWLFSDPEITLKPPLLGLLACDPNYPASHTRWRHCAGAVPRNWPSFNAGTQGDFASYVLSGIGRLARLLGHKGLIIVMDEMEKWQELNWKEQDQAGNLLGGLIWGAGAEEGHRGDENRPWQLSHSGRSGGYPFTTENRCHLGVAIAMTPRSERNPEDTWSQYGLIEVAELPTLTRQKLAEYCTLTSPRFAAAYGLEPPDTGSLARIAAEATAIWIRQPEQNMRYGVQAAIAAFDHWRHEYHFSND